MMTLIANPWKKKMSQRPIIMEKGWYQFQKLIKFYLKMKKQEILRF